MKKQSNPSHRALYVLPSGRPFRQSFVAVYRMLPSAPATLQLLELMVFPCWSMRLPFVPLFVPTIGYALLFLLFFHSSVGPRRGESPLPTGVFLDVLEHRLWYALSSTCSPSTLMSDKEESGHSSRYRSLVFVRTGFTFCAFQVEIVFCFCSMGLASSMGPLHVLLLLLSLVHTFGLTLFFLSFLALFSLSRRHSQTIMRSRSKEEAPQQEHCCIGTEWQVGMGFFPTLCCMRVWCECAHAPRHTDDRCPSAAVWLRSGRLGTTSSK